MWKSTDNGSTWTQVTVNAEWGARDRFSCVALPDDSIVIMGGYAGGSSYYSDVWKSQDGGATWNELVTYPGWNARNGHTSVALSDGTIVLMGGYDNSQFKNDIWKSEDNGSSWTEVTTSGSMWSGREQYSSVVLPDDSIVLMGGNNGGTLYNDVWRSTDGGITWSEMTSNAGWPARQTHTSAFLPDGSIIVMGGRGSSGDLNDVWRSNDNGSTWTEISSNADWSKRDYLRSSVLPDGTVLVTGGHDSTYKNDAWILPTAGSTEQNPVHTYTEEGTYNVTLKASNSDGSNIATFTDLITVTIEAPVADFTSNVTSGEAPFSVDFTDLSLNGPTGWSWYFGDDDLSDSSWTEVNSNANWPGRSGHASVTLPDGSIVLMGGLDSGGNYLNDTWYSTDNGTTWNLMNTSAWPARSYHSSVVLSDGSIILMGGFDSGGNYLNDTWYSNDNGATWTEINSSSGWSERLAQTAVVLPDDSIVLMGGYDSNGNYLNDTWRSTDKGATWTEVNSSSGWSKRYYHSSVALPDGSIILMGGRDSVGNYLNDTWYSNDKGARWTEVNSNANWSARYKHTSVSLPDGSIILLGGFDSGTNYQNDAWYSTNNGTTWTEINSNTAWPARMLHNTVVLPDGSIVLMGGRGNFNIKLNDVWRLTTASSTEQNPKHTYTETGTYQVTLQAYNSGGYNGTVQTGYITVALEPVSNFTSNVISGTNPLSVAFTDQSENEPTSWEWNFGDGSTSTDQNPIHTYSTAGTYNVSLNASNVGGSNNKTVTSYITVANIPVADFTSNVTSGALPLTVSFSDQSTNEPTEWEWNFGDGNTSTEQSPTHTYSMVGTYNVSLNASNVGGNNSTSVTDYITVAIAPVANFTTDITSGIAPLLVNFTDLSTNGPTAWEWDFGDGTNATGQDQVHTYSTAGTYTVSLNASNVGGSNITTMTGYITVDAPEEESSRSSSRRSIPVSQPSEIVASTHSSMQRILGGSSVEYDLSLTESPVVSIKFDAKDNEGLVIASVQVLSDSPNTPAPAGDSYQFLSIGVGKQGTISSQNAENILINFRVSREWILENNLDPATIRMARYHEGEWEELPTDRVDEDDEFLYFVAETQGFSIFSVVGDEVKTTTGEDTPTTAEFAEDEPTQSEPAEEKSTPGFSAVMGLVFVTVAFLVSRKNRQN